MADVRSYEKVMKADGTYDIRETDSRTKRKRIISERQRDYQLWLAKGNSPTVVEYVPEPEVPYETRLNEAKQRKIEQIKHAWSTADSDNPCLTGLKCVDGSDLVIQYAAYDRDIWLKGVVGAILQAAQDGHVVLTEEDIAWLKSETITPSILAKAADQVTTVRDFYNNFKHITIGTMREAAFTQNKWMEADLKRKWTLESMIAQATTIEQVQAIDWDTELPPVVPVDA